MTQTAIRYTVTSDPLAHCFRIHLAFDAPPGRQRFTLPSWLRGSYLVRDFARHIVALGAQRGGHDVPLQRLDKRSFAIDGDGAITLRYTVNAYDASVRKAWLDTRRGFFNGSSLFYCPAGFERSAFEVEIRRPDPALCTGWKLATALPAVEIDGDGFGHYRAASYEELIDCPVEMADWQRVDFDVDGIPHALILSGRCTPDLPRLAADITRVCHAQRELFGQQPALDRYLFLTQVTGNGYGGLEHRSSTALVTARDALPRPGQSELRKGYRNFLGLVSHEYFHLWNVKRITPQRFAESDLAAEAYSQDLWAYEGVTSYYDDLFLLRAGIIDAPAYLDLLAEAATRLQRAPGRKVQTLADASFEAWIKYYQPDEQTPNATVSYYLKGALAALCLDLHLRRHSRLTLDDLLRALWTRYGSRDIGVPEGGLEQLAQECSGIDLRPQFDTWLRSTDDLPLAELLGEFGVSASLHAAHGPADTGGRSDGRVHPAVWLGMALRSGETAIAHVFSDSPAARAGLAGGDVLIALDGLRLSSSNWSARLEALAPGDRLVLSYFRGDELLSTTLSAASAPADTWTLVLAEASGEVLERRRAWLGA